MTQPATGTYTEESKTHFENTLARAFKAAHLLTANFRQAEVVVLKAIDRFDAYHDTEEALFGYALYGAVEASDEPRSESTGWPMPAELQAVLNLARDLRHCFVLRVLIGMSRQACAQLLGFKVRRVDVCTLAAMRQLAGVDA